jgi:hypothetical protein
VLAAAMSRGAAPLASCMLLFDVGACARRTRPVEFDEQRGEGGIGCVYLCGRRVDAEKLRTRNMGWG